MRDGLGYETRNQIHLRVSTALHDAKDIIIFSRGHLLAYIAREDVTFLPMFLFADTSGLYRNMYQTLESLYLIIQSFTKSSHLESSFTILTLNPFRAKTTQERPRDIFSTLS